MLRWDFDRKCGELDILAKGVKPYTLNLYQGNAYLIMVHEYEENGKKYYELYSFFADKDHMNNCLGITKGHDNIFGNELKAIRLNTENTHLWEIAKAFGKAYNGTDFTITINLKSPA